MELVGRSKQEMVDLAQVIEKHISYDCDGGGICPHCKKYIREPHYWLYHKWTLACEIARFKHWPDVFIEKIEEALEDIDVTGNKKIDSKVIAEAVIV